MTTPPKNPYDVLNVPRDADDAAIKKAYREFAKQFHPDKAGPQADKQGLTGEARKKFLSDAEKKFKEVANAYSQIGTADKRAGIFPSYTASSAKRPASNYDDVFRHPRPNTEGGGKGAYDLSGAEKLGTHTKNRDFTDRNFAFMNDFTNKKFTKCNFSGASMPNAGHAKFIDCKMHRINASFADFSHTLFERADLTGANLSSWGVTLKNAIFRDCIFHGTKFRVLQLKDAKFEGSIDGLVLPELGIEDVDLSKADTRKLMLEDFEGKVFKPRFDAAGKPMGILNSMARDSKSSVVFDNIELIVMGVIAAIAVGGAVKKHMQNKDKPEAPQNWAGAVSAQQAMPSGNLYR